MSRVRLTKRIKKAESQADGLFPGDVGNLERSKNYHPIDEYHTFEQTVNHELPDMRHEWKEDKRDQNNIPVPKVAEIYAAAQNAIKLSMMFLGEDAPEKEIEAQARDFMKLGNKRLVASMNRWIATDDCTEEACNDKQAEQECEKEADEVSETEETTVPQVAEEETPEEETTEEVEDEVIADEQQEVEIQETPTDVNTDVDFETSCDEESVEADEQLEQVFADDAQEDDKNQVVAKVAQKKQGIKKIACQPKLVRVANKKSDELEGLWDKLDVPRI